MLVFHKERYCTLLRTIAAVVVCLFIYNDIAFALSPKLSLNRSEFEEEYLARSLLLNERSAAQYIGVNTSPGLQRFDDGVCIRAVRGLLKNVGQLAKIDIDNETSRPVICVDSSYYYNETVIGFEKVKIAEFEALRSKKKLTCRGMAAWLIEYRDKPDADIGGRTSRQWADSINSKAHARYPGISRLYDRIKAKYQKAILRGQADRAEGLLNFASMYSFYRNALGKTDASDTRINIAAHEDKAAAEYDVSAKERREHAARIWMEENVHELKDKVIMSLSMEGNVPEFEGSLAQNANTKGGLGAYFGDKLEGFAKIGMKGYGAQPGYSHVIIDGKLVEVDYNELIRKGILKPVFVGADAIIVRAWDEDPEARTEHEEDRNNPKIKVEVYQINRGGTPDYVFRSKVLDVLYPDRKMMHLLYPDPKDRAGLDDETLARRHRFTQEIVFGKAVFQLLKKLNIVPDILHLNEAHTVVAASQMRGDESYDNTAIVYTNHTLVPSGLETFHLGVLKTSIDRMTYVLGLPDNTREGRKFKRMRSAFLRPDGIVDFCYAAMKLADVINAVSDEHAKATIRLFEGMYGDEFDKPVTGILNGSGETWMSDQLIALKEKGAVPDEETLWNIHEDSKAQAFEEIKKRTGIKLDPSRPTAWAVRRLVDYKSQYPLLRFLVHLITADKGRAFTREELTAIWYRDIPDLAQSYNKDTVDSVLDMIFKKGQRKTVNGLGMQLVVGWPVPVPDNTEFWEQEFRRLMLLPDLKGRFVALDSDSKLLKMQAIGADICINMPRPLEEACGTSDQRTGLNGGVNIAIKGAGPIEWIIDYNEDPVKGCGFFIDSYTREMPAGLEADNARFYREAPGDIFEKCEACSRLFYQEGKKEWRRLMRNAYLRANKLVTAEAMEKRYAQHVYLPAVRKKADTRTIYELVIRDHYDRKNNIPGLKNALEELPFIAETGVKYIYLLGLMEHSDRPFEIMDPKNIDRRAGSISDLEAFIDRAHELGLKVGMVDWLANQHVSKKSKVCRERPDMFLYTNVSDGNYWLDKGSKVFRGKAVIEKASDDELRRRIETGRKIVEKVGAMSEQDLAGGTFLEIDGRKIHYKMADRDIRNRVHGVKIEHLPVIVSEEDALFLVSATDLVSLKTDYPHRWQAAAQPDLSHPDIVKQSIEIGRVWMDMGIDGFRVDAAPSTFPDRIRDNWGIDVSENLIGIFVREMRRIKPDCFFLFEAFERQNELLAMADGNDCAIYSWRCRNYATEALRPNGNISDLIGYLRDLQYHPDRRNFVNLGPEHDAFEFEDPWSKLSYQDRNILYFIYDFIPGYKLVFDGELFGTPHEYKHEPSKAPAAPQIKKADKIKRDVRARLFGLSKEHKQLISGDYRYLETDAPWHAMGLARFDDDEIVVGAFNVANNSGWARLHLEEIINMQVKPHDMDGVRYVKENLQLGVDGVRWVSTEKMEFTARKLYEEGLNVYVGPKGCEVIILRKVRGGVKFEHSARGVGSTADLLETIKKDDSLLNAATDASKGISVKELIGPRGFKERTVQNEFKAARDLGIFVPISPGSDRVRFSDMMLGPDREFTKTLISAINDIRYQVGKKGEERPLHRGDIPQDTIAAVRKLVEMTVVSEMEKEFVVPQGKTMYHIVEKDVIPYAQRSTLVQAANNILYRDNKGPERTVILNGSRTIAEMISEIRAKDANAIIDVALSDESHIASITDASIKKMVFKTECQFIDLDGVLKALRALHYDSADDTLSVLLRLYSAMAGIPPEGHLPVVSGVYVFNLPRAARENIDNIPKLNEHLLQLLTAA